MDCGERPRNSAASPLSSLTPVEPVEACATVIRARDPKTDPDLRGSPGMIESSGPFLYNQEVLNRSSMSPRSPRQGDEAPG
jgi:hypothetical protein